MTNASYASASAAASVSASVPPCHETPLCDLTAPNATALDDSQVPYYTSVFMTAACSVIVSIPIRVFFRIVFISNTIESDIYLYSTLPKQSDHLPFRHKRQGKIVVKRNPVISAVFKYF